jgi:hypothetical protein
MTSKRVGTRTERHRSDPAAGRDEERREPDEESRLVVYRDEAGAVVINPTHAASGEILHDVCGALQRHAWFRIEEVELDWLPVHESAFLLWVLALLAGIWLAIGVVLHYT